LSTNEVEQIRLGCHNMRLVLVRDGHSAVSAMLDARTRLAAGRCRHKPKDHFLPGAIRRAVSGSEGFNPLHLNGCSGDDFNVDRLAPMQLATQANERLHSAVEELHLTGSVEANHGGVCVELTCACDRRNDRLMASTRVRCMSKSLSFSDL
jgi:hypothetical protein